MSVTQFIINNWYLFAALVVILVLLLAGPINQVVYGIKSVSPAQAIQLINQGGGAFVDVCEAQEFKGGHIPNAVNMPLSAMKGGLKPLERYKNKPLVVSCRHGNRSMKGAVMLRKRGFATVYSLRGGLVAWQRDNLPVEKE